MESLHACLSSNTGIVVMPAVSPYRTYASSLLLGPLPQDIRIRDSCKDPASQIRGNLCGDQKEQSRMSMSPINVC